MSRDDGAFGTIGSPQAIAGPVRLVPMLGIYYAAVGAESDVRSQVDLSNARFAKMEKLLAILAIAIMPTLTFAQDQRVRIEASEGAGRYDNVTWSALSCFSPPCAANQPLHTTGNGKPYLLQIDQCDSKLEAWEGNGEFIEKGVKMLGFHDCSLFFAARNSSVGREILRTCPIGSRCHIETSILGDSGIPFIVNIEKIK